MSITIRCSACSREFPAPRALVGKRVRCRACGHIQRACAIEPAALESSVYPVAPELPAPHSVTTAHSAPPLRNSRRRRWRDVRQHWLFQDSQVEGIACGLLALSAADLFMTFTLLRTSPAFFESNPLAQWFYAKWNMAGMVTFKFSMIAAVIAVSEFIERRRPGWGRLVLLVGCVGAAYAIYKGFNLFINHTGDAPPEAD